MYLPVASHPPLTGYRGILVGLLGLGFSNKPHDFGYAVSDHAEYLADLGASLGLDRFVLCGHSRGVRH